MSSRLSAAPQVGWPLYICTCRIAPRRGALRKVGLDTGREFIDIGTDNLIQHLARLVELKGGHRRNPRGLRNLCFVVHINLQESVGILCTSSKLFKVWRYHLTRTAPCRREICVKRFEAASLFASALEGEKVLLAFENKKFLTNHTAIGIVFRCFKGALIAADDDLGRQGTVCRCQDRRARGHNLPSRAPQHFCKKTQGLRLWGGGPGPAGGVTAHEKRCG